MKTYTEEEVRSLIDENLKHLEEIERLKDQLSKETLLRESAEKKYCELCERCMTFYITERDITTDTIFVQSTAPRFMTQDDFTNGVVQHLISMCNAERERHIFSATNTMRCKEQS